MDNKKTIENLKKNIQSFNWKGIDWASTICSVICLIVAGIMTYVTVWAEYVWLSDTAKKTAEGMRIFWLTTNSGANKPLYFSLIICGFVVWSVLAFALMALGKKGFFALKKKFNWHFSLNLKAKGHK